MFRMRLDEFVGEVSFVVSPTRAPYKSARTISAQKRKFLTALVREVAQPPLSFPSALSQNFPA